MNVEPKFHPFCAIFPLLEGAGFEALKEDIQQHGQRQKILIDESGMILDGRNRWRACRELEIEPEVVVWCSTTDDPEKEKLDLVVSLNVHRRHLNATQKALLADELEPMYAVVAKERMLAGKSVDGTAGGRGKKNPTQKVEQGFDKNESTAAAQAAKATGANRQYVSAVTAMKKQEPELYAEMKAGRLQVPEAKRKQKERKLEQKREANRKLLAETGSLTVLPDGSFATIVMDLPWWSGDEGDNDQTERAKRGYATMSFEEIAALPVPALAAENAHLYLRVTNHSMPKGLDLVEKWGFRYITMLTWCKPSFGMGTYFRGSTEHILFGVRGSLPLLVRDQGTHFAAPRDEMPFAKPEKFYEIVECCSPGPYLEMFARKPRKDWRAWEAEAKAAA